MRVARRANWWKEHEADRINYDAVVSPSKQQNNNGVRRPRWKIFRRDTRTSYYRNQTLSGNIYIYIYIGLKGSCSPRSREHDNVIGDKLVIKISKFFGDPVEWINCEIALCKPIPRIKMVSCFNLSVHLRFRRFEEANESKSLKNLKEKFKKIEQS